MRYAAILLVAGCLALPALVEAKGRPAPVSCPEDGDVGAMLSEACPCDGKLLPTGEVEPWRNHGKYVSCVVRLRNALRKAGCLDDTAKRTIARCAAKSTCGKPGRVLCCAYDLGECSDPMPGDLVAAGVCSNDPALACDTAADCTKSSASLASDEAACTERGGVAVGGGSVCDACPPPPAPAP